MVVKWTGHVADIGETRGAYRVVLGRREWKRPLGGPRRRWEDNIKIDFQEMDWRAWIGFMWHRIGTGGGLL